MVWLLGLGPLVGLPPPPPPKKENLLIAACEPGQWDGSWTYPRLAG